MPNRPPIFKPAHAPSYEQERGNFRARGYTTAWTRLALRYRKANPLCLGCLAAGWTTLAQCVDHTVPHKGDPALLWNAANLQPLCRWHHDVIKQQLELMHLRGEITDADLRIDSSIAIELSKRKR